ncbi:glycosyltransferase family 4 protein [Patescibacteria group bacterium]|nr:glycosyltransferase family 4 protein [Patescibacteria group bacterium]MBU1703568.1 glycosyltransferase family 4 protein [Patescibacteria group bacterium]MBU1954081.1 glycosyltransferase family 4 protein [Patescibacteria group bacterium]
MIVGINGRFLTKPYTGIGQYTRHLFSHLAADNPHDKFIFAVPDLFAISDETDGIGGKNVEIVVLPEKFFGFAGMRKTYWEQVQVPRLFKKRGVDIAHFPYPSNPWLGFKKPVVVTVHDTIPWTMAAYRKSFLTRLYQNRAKKAVKKADAVVTVSNSSKKEIVKVCGVKEGLVHVINNAPGSAFAATEKGDGVSHKEILQSYGIDPEKPYFLYIGGYDERKNVRSLMEVYMREIAPNFEVNFVLAGAKSLNNPLYGSFDDLTKAINGSSLRTYRGNMVVTGYLAEKDLPALYQSSFAFLTFSNREGFNLPLAEAAAAHTVIIASDLPVHWEIAGDAPIFCPPDDKKQLSTLMKKVIADKAFYKKQKQKMKDYVSPFSWEKSARQLMELYKKII